MIYTAPDRLTLQNMEKASGESYKEYAVKWKNVASLVQPPITNREKNSIFMDTLPSSYYDMLVNNVFLEFGDLMYFVGKIENEIKREKIMDNGASILEKKRIIFYEHVQAMTRERGSKRKSRMTQDEHIKNFPHLSLHTQVPLACSPSSRMPI